MLKRGRATGGWSCSCGRRLERFWRTISERILEKPRIGHERTIENAREKTGKKRIRFEKIEKKEKTRRKFGENEKGTVSRTVPEGYLGKNSNAIVVSNEIEKNQLASEWKETCRQFWKIILTQYSLCVFQLKNLSNLNGYYPDLICNTPCLLRLENKLFNFQNEHFATQNLNKL